MGDENREDLIKQILIQRRTNDESQEQIKVKISENNKLVGISTFQEVTTVILLIFG